MFLKSGWSCWNFLYEWLKLCQFARPTEVSMAKSEELSPPYWNSLHLEQWLISGQFNHNILYDCLTLMSNNNVVPTVLYECDIPISHFLQSIYHLWLSFFWRTPKCQSTENNLVWRMSVSLTSERLLFLRQSLFPSSEVTTVLETICVSITGKWSPYWRLSICPLSIHDHSLIWQRWSLKSYTLFQTLLTKCPTLSNCEPHFSPSNITVIKISDM